MTFESLKISQLLIAGLQKSGIFQPTPIQEKMIPPVLAGLDVLAEAPTGTGKTLAFGLPLLMRTEGRRSLSGLVLAPTRELAGQIVGELGRLTGPEEIVLLCGGHGLGGQAAALSGARIAVGTPGRILDHLRRGTLKLNDVSLTVLDEADELLDMGFAPEVKKILDALPAGQILMTSATLSREVQSLSALCQKAPVRVRADIRGESLPAVRAFAVLLREKQKYEALKALLREEDLRRSLVFCNTRAKAETLNERLDREGFLTLALHGDLNQRGREKALEAFRRGEANLLIASNVAARGLDLPEVEAVFNYDFPLDEESYVHRIGRTARAGREGLAFSFVCPNEISRMRRCEHFTRRLMEERVIPGLSAAAGRKEEAEHAVWFRIEGLSAGSEGEAVRWLRREAGLSAEELFGLRADRDGWVVEAALSAAERLIGLSGREADGKSVGVRRLTDSEGEEAVSSPRTAKVVPSGRGKDRRPVSCVAPKGKPRPNEWYPFRKKESGKRGKK